MVLATALDAAEAVGTDPYSRLRMKIPRIGRRGPPIAGPIGIVSDYDEAESFPMSGSLSSFFLKSSKSVPRIGRRQDLPESHDGDPWPTQLGLDQQEETVDESKEAQRNAFHVYKALLERWLKRQQEADIMKHDVTA